MSIESYIRAMPKAELHIHLEGSFDKQTLHLIAEENDVPDELKHYQDWLRLLDKPEYDRLEDIARTYCSWLQSPENITRVVYDLGVALHKQNVRYAEVTVNPTYYMQNPYGFDAFLDALNDGRDRVLRAWGVHMNWIFAIPRDEPRRADEVARWVTSAMGKRGNILALGLNGREDAHPAALFERAFHTVEKKLTPRAPHAGELRQAEGILEVIHTLLPNRIYDGWGAADAPDVLKLLVERGISLGVSMARSLCYGQLATYAQYPLRDLVDADVTITLGSDMPSFLKTSLNDQYLAAVEHCGLELSELEDIALNAVRTSFLSEDHKTNLMTQFRAEYAALRDIHLT